MQELVNAKHVFIEAMPPQITMHCTLLPLFDVHNIIITGPKPETVVDFWRLVWQERPPTIVMITNLKEGNKKKCEQYWPESGSINYGPFKISLTEQQVLADYCIRTFLVTVSLIVAELRLQCTTTEWVS